VVDWIEGETIPKCPEVLSIAGLFGVKVYQILDMPVPDEELVKIYMSFSHLSGEYQSRVAHAIWEADVEMKQSQVLPESEEAKAILTKTFESGGLLFLAINLIQSNPHLGIFASEMFCWKSAYKDEINDVGHLLRLFCESGDIRFGEEKCGSCKHRISRLICRTSNHQEVKNN
jgi:hypothetical protein